MAEIKNIHAREILDSRGFPTLEVEVQLTTGVVGRASVPTGASTGKKEALELRDGGQRYNGRGVQNAIEKVEGEIRQALVGHDVRHQKGIDDLLITLDGTVNKGRLGANSILAVSEAVAYAAANAVKRPLYEYLGSNEQTPFLLPVPLMNVINGGAHADNNIDIQEFMIIPLNAQSFKEALRLGVEVFHALKAVLKKQGLSTLVGDEGGFAPNLPSNEAAIEILLKAIADTGLKAGQDIYLGLDLASNEFYQNGQYVFRHLGKSYSSDEFIEYLVKWAEQYPILSIEDGLSEEDITGWQNLTKRLGTKLQLVGDDLFVTNPQIFMQGIKDKLANSILIKPNQIGTLTETFKTIDMAKEFHYSSIISHRSGETDSSFIADLVVAKRVGQIKTGAPCRGERVAKYNELLRIEDELGSKATFAGKNAFKNFLK